MHARPEHLDELALGYARKDFTTLRQDMTAQQALDAIRTGGVGEKIIYFYILDAEDRLVGVLPTRRLLTISPEQRIGDIMITRVVAIPPTATVLEACEFFVLHKFFAFPVIDAERRVLGVVDVALFTDEVFDIAEREQMDDVFEAIGFRVAQVRDAAPGKAFRVRFPWLLATIGSGTVCALLAGAFEATLSQSLVMAFFITLVLGLGESVSIQSMTVTIQALRSTQPTLRWYAGMLRREIATALLLGGGCGCLVAGIVWLWRGDGMAAIVVGASILLSICMACLLGLSVPSLLHALKLDPKIAAGPITLALADVTTLLFFFSLGAMFLGGNR